MVHRPSDSRLLVNLLDHEKDYSKELSVLLDKSQASLASFSAYASASAPPTSQIIIQVAGALAGADEALRRYAASLEGWQEQLKNLKTLEDDVGNIMRDREILVTRLIKLSKSQKPTRDSLLASSSTSTLTKLPEVLTSTKLAAAQSELQACEAHLATKERDLDALRKTAFVFGLSARCKALVECGWTWGEMGKEGLRALESMESSVHASNGGGVANGYAGITSPTLHTYKPLPEGPSSDLSSIGPSQSASQTTHVTGEPVAVVPSRLLIPPAHMISDQTFPVEEEAGAGSSADEPEDSYEVHENERFAKRSSKRDSKSKPTANGISSSREKFSSASSLSTHAQVPKRTRRTSGSVLGSIAAFFHRTPADPEQPSGSDQSPTKKQGRWHTRTDKHLASSRKGKEKETDSDEDLTVKQRSPVAASTPMFTSESGQKLKKSSGGPSKRAQKAFSMTHMEPPDLGQGILSDGGVDRRSSRRVKKARRASADHVMSDPETLPQTKKKLKAAVDTPVVEHRGKDAVPTTLTPSTSAKIRKPSIGHAHKANGSLPVALPTEAPLSLSRNSSLSKRSITSSASAPAHLSAKDKTVILPAGSSPLNPNTHSHKRSSSLDARPEDSEKPTPQKHRRAQSTSIHPMNSSRTHLPGNHSLMTIVEDVTKQNRDSRIQRDPNLMLFVAKAPPPISASTEFLKLPDGPINIHQYASASTSHIPPPDKPVKGLPSRDKTPSQHSIPVTPTIPSPAEPVIHVPSPDMKPLRSAMRNSSRSPSPVVLSLPPMAVAASTSTLQLPPGPAKALPSSRRETAPIVPTKPAPNGIATEDDTSSISSYETTNDVLLGEADEEDEGQATSFETPTLSTPKPHSPPVPPPKELPNSGSDGSQLSRSTGSTTLATNSTHPPTRRKSVRMSLPPTFSVTPPAIDEDDLDKGRRYDPWSPSNSYNVGNGGGWRSKIREPVDRDIWRDSSDSEDEEYSRAKRLLGRLSRKK